jgi:hypothetical protein
MRMQWHAHPFLSVGGFQSAQPCYAAASAQPLALLLMLLLMFWLPLPLPLLSPPPGADWPEAEGGV